jgi:hypothetical protein
MLIDDPSCENDNTDKELPHLVKLRRDCEDAMATKSTEDKAEPKRTKDRIEKEEPHVAQCITLSVFKEPTAHRPQTDNAEPTREKLRNERLEPNEIELNVDRCRPRR